jgi:hypothetical protein
MLMDVFALTFAYILFRLLVERLFAAGRAKVVRLSFVLGLASRGRGVNILPHTGSLTVVAIGFLLSSIMAVKYRYGKRQSAYTLMRVFASH